MAVNPDKVPKQLYTIFDFVEIDSVNNDESRPSTSNSVHVNLQKKNKTRLQVWPQEYFELLDRFERKCVAIDLSIKPKPQPALPQPELSQPELFNKLSLKSVTEEVSNSPKENSDENITPTSVEEQSPESSQKQSQSDDLAETIRTNLKRIMDLKNSSEAIFKKPFLAPLKKRFKYYKNPVEQQSTTFVALSKYSDICINPMITPSQSFIGPLPQKYDLSKNPMIKRPPKIAVPLKKRQDFGETSVIKSWLLTENKDKLEHDNPLDERKKRILSRVFKSQVHNILEDD